MPRRAFTLIELLVVVTIIVVLLALLTPALDKAMYSAELAVCGAKLKALASTVETYAMGNRRTYPVRKWVEGKVNERPILLAYMLSYPALTFDDRPVLRQYMSLNDSLNCPLTKEVNVEPPGIDPDTSPFSTYGLWFGFKYQNERGMRKIGDRIEYLGDRFSVLAGDWDGTYEDVPSDINTHPDHDGGMAPLQRTNAPSAVVASKASYSFWQSPKGVRRGLVDLNYAFTDGAVTRYHEVKRLERGDDCDPRMTSLPGRFHGDDANPWRTQLPQR